MWLTRSRPAVQLAVLLLAVAAAATLIGLQGNDAAFLGVFPALVPRRPGAAGSPQRAVAGAAIAAVSAASAGRRARAHRGHRLERFRDPGLLPPVAVRPAAAGRATSGQNSCSPSWSRPGPRRPRPPRWPSGSAWPAKCTMCSPIRCPVWC